MRIMYTDRGRHADERPKQIYKTKNTRSQVLGLQMARDSLISFTDTQKHTVCCSFIQFIQCADTAPVSDMTPTGRCSWV